MERWFRDALRDIAAGLDLELYFVLVVSIGILAYHLFEPLLGQGTKGSPESLQVVSSATLLILTALSLGLLGDRKERRALAQSVARLQAEDNRSIGEFLVPWSQYSDSFRERLARATTFSLLVRTPHRTVQRYEMQIRHLLALDQARLHILAVEPDSPAMSILCDSEPQCSEMMRVFLDYTVPALMHAGGSAPRLEVRVLKTLPSCLLALIDEDQPDGMIFATIITWGQARDLRPSMSVTRKDTLVYEFFRTEFQELWNSAHAAPQIGSGEAGAADAGAATAAMTSGETRES